MLLIKFKWYCLNKPLLVSVSSIIFSGDMLYHQNPSMHQVLEKYLFEILNLFEKLKVAVNTSAVLLLLAKR